MNISKRIVGLALVGATGLGGLFWAMSSGDTQSPQNNGKQNNNSSSAPVNSAGAPVGQVTNVWAGAANPFAVCNAKDQVSCAQGNAETAHVYPEEFKNIIDTNIRNSIDALQKAKAPDASVKDRADFLQIAIRKFLDAKYANNKYVSDNKVNGYVPAETLPDELKNQNTLATMYCEALRARLLELGQGIRMGRDGYQKIADANEVRELIFYASINLHSYMGSNSASGYNMWFEFNHDFVKNPKNDFPKVDMDKMSQLAGFYSFSDLQTKISDWRSGRSPVTP